MSRKQRGGRFSQYKLSPRQRRCVLAAAVIIPFAAFVWFLPTQAPRQQVYHAKPLALWLQTYAPSSPFARNSPKWKETDDAVRQMGTNCIPVLLRMICEKDSTLKLRLVALAQKQDLIKIKFTRAADKNVEASRAFIVLGDAAKDAVPELVKAYDEDVSVPSRCAIAEALGWIGPSAKPAIPLLLRVATNSDAQLRANALWTLGEIHREPSLCVPRLINALGDSNSWPQLCAAHALGRFGADALAAIPSLTRLAQAEFLGGQDNRSFLNIRPVASPIMADHVQVTIEARNALQRIGPDTETPPEFDLLSVDSPIAPP